MLPKPIAKRLLYMSPGEQLAIEIDDASFLFLDVVGKNFS
jgi:hypothetical protein